MTSTDTAVRLLDVARIEQDLHTAGLTDVAIGFDAPMSAHIVTAIK